MQALRPSRKGHICPANAARGREAVNNIAVMLTLLQLSEATAHIVADPR